MSEKTRNRKLDIAAYIKAHGTSDYPIGSSVIARELGVKQKQIWDAMKGIKEMFPEIKTAANRGYYWDGDDTVSTTEVISRELGIKQNWEDGAMTKTELEVEKIIDILKENGETPTTADELAEILGVNRQIVYNCINRHIRGKYPEFKNNPDGFGYIWAKPNDKKDAIPERYNDKKNDEGYHDPTAAAVLEKLERNGKDRAGEIWSTGNDDLYFLVLAVFRGLVIGINVCRMDEWYDPEYDKTINIRGKSYYINLRRIVSKPAKIMVANYGNIGPERLNFVKTAVTKLLGIKAEKVVEKPVEVIREKIVEKPVEVEKIIFKTKFDRKKLRRPIGNRQTIKQIEAAEDTLNIQQQMLAMAEQRADIWEQAFKLIALGGNA